MAVGRDRKKEIDPDHNSVLVGFTGDHGGFDHQTVMYKKIPGALKFRRWSQKRDNLVDLVQRRFFPLIRLSGKGDLLLENQERQRTARTALTEKRLPDP